MKHQEKVLLRHVARNFLTHSLLPLAGVLVNPLPIKSGPEGGLGFLK